MSGEFGNTLDEMNIEITHIASNIVTYDNLVMKDDQDYSQIMYMTALITARKIKINKLMSKARKIYECDIRGRNDDYKKNLNSVLVQFENIIDLYL